MATSDVLKWALTHPPLMAPKYDETTFEFYYNYLDKEKTRDFLLNHYENIESILLETDAMQIIPLLCSSNLTISPQMWKIIRNDLIHMVINTVIETFYAGGHMESHLELDETNHWKMSIEEGRRAIKEDITDQINIFVFKKTAQTCTPYGFI